MNPSLLFTLIIKDLRLFFKNRFFALITVLGLVFFLVVFFLMPNTVDEALEMGWYGAGLPPEFTAELEAEGLVLNHYPSEEALRAAVLAGDEPVGIALPADFVQALAAGDKPQMRVYLQSGLPDEYQDVYTLLASSLGSLFAGQTINIEAEEIVLGPDMAGRQIPPRQRMLPLLVVFLIVMEIFGLATLLSTERETGTLRALLVTPLRVEGLFASKAATGVLMTFIQAVLLLLITGGLRREPALVLTAVLLGALLITGISFLIASVARDFMAVTGWAMLVMIVLAIPTFNLLLPGLTTGWIRIIPSYYLVDTVYRVINFEAGWSQVYMNLLALLAFAMAFLGLGVFAMGRKLQ